MAITTSATTTTRELRGMGSNAGVNGVNQRSLQGAKFVRLPWTAADNDTVTPGEGGVPNGVIAMAWQAFADNQATSINFSTATRLGTFAVEGATPRFGYLICWYRRA